MNSIRQTLATIDDKESQYRIRPMHQTDINVVLTIDQATWDSDAWTYGDFLKYFNDPLWNCWILDSTTSTTDSPVLGYGFQHIYDEAKMISSIASIFIQPDHRCRGLGGILLRHMIDYSREIGTLIVDLQVKITNRYAYMLYVKHGFTIVRVLHQYYSDNSNAYLMQLTFN